MSMRLLGKTSLSENMNPSHKFIVQNWLSDVKRKCLFPFPFLCEIDAIPKCHG